MWLLFRHRRTTTYWQNGYYIFLGRKKKKKGNELCTFLSTFFNFFFPSFIATVVTTREIPRRDDLVFFFLKWKRCRSCRIFTMVCRGGGEGNTCRSNLDEMITILYISGFFSPYYFPHFDEKPSRLISGRKWYRRSWRIEFLMPVRNIWFSGWGFWREKKSFSPPPSVQWSQNS